MFKFMPNLVGVGSICVNYTKYNSSERWEISEGDLKISLRCELVPPKDLGRIVHLGTWPYSLKFRHLSLLIIVL